MKTSALLRSDILKLFSEGLKVKKHPKPKSENQKVPKMPVCFESTTALNPVSLTFFGTCIGFNKLKLPQIIKKIADHQNTN